MKKKGSGGIVLMSSLAGTQGKSQDCHLRGDQGIQHNLCRRSVERIKTFGIDVLASCAGAILTPGYKNTQHQKPAPGTLTPAQVAAKTLNALGRGL
jgi:short-subunit dehydrogenase